MVSLSRVSLGSLRAGQGHSHIQCRSESGARHRGQRALTILACRSSVYSAYREPSTFHPVMSFRIVARRHNTYRSIGAARALLKPIVRGRCTQ